MPVDATAPALARLDRVELAHAGTWSIALGGEQTFTPDDFAAAIAAQDCPAVRRPIVKLGHFDARTAGYHTPDGNLDGEPALGWVASMGLAHNHRTLVADLVGMPAWLGHIAASAYPDRSVEGTRNYRCAIGHVHPFVISAVALLGVTPPGVGTLTSLQDHVRALYGVAAAADDTATGGGEPFVVTFHAKEALVPTPRADLLAAAATVDELRSAFHSDAPYDLWITEIQLSPLQLIVTSDNGSTFRVPVTINPDNDAFVFGQMVEVEVAYIDEAASEVVAAAGKPLAVRFATRAGSRPTPVAATGEVEQPTDPAPPPPPPPPEVPAPQPPVQSAAPAQPAAEPEPQPEPEGGDDVSLSEFRSRLDLPDDADEAAVLAAVDELKTRADTPAEPDPQLVAASAKRDQEFAATIGQIKTLSEELAAVKAEKAAERKTAFFAAAFQQGKLRPSDRESWESRYDKAPDLVKEIIDAMAPGTAVPVAAAGYVGDPEPVFTDDDLMRLLPPEMRDAVAGKVT